MLAAAGRDEASVGNYVLSYVVHVCASFLVYLAFLVSWFSWLPLASSGVSDFLWLVLGLLLGIWGIRFNCFLGVRGIKGTLSQSSFYSLSTALSQL